MTDLPRLDRFAASLQPSPASPEQSTYSFQLYELLCQAVRLYVHSNIPDLSADATLSHGLPDSLGDFDFDGFGQFGLEMETAPNESLEAAAAQTYGLSDWYHENQQMMSLLDGDVMF